MPTDMWELPSTCRPDGVGTVTLEEKEKFQEIKERLRVLLEKQITNFRFVVFFSIPTFDYKTIGSFLSLSTNDCYRLVLLLLNLFLNCGACSVLYKPSE